MNRNTDNEREANFVIAGTQKAGTTSVFTWLGEHPEVCASRRKETDFFRHEFSGDSTADRISYQRHFQHCPADVPVVMEASPAYLGEAALVAPRMSLLIPDTRLLFILRDPVERLQSSFHFHSGRLDIDPDITFRDYVARCFAYDRGEASPEDLGIDDWFLKALRSGCYVEYLQHFQHCFPSARLKITFFDELVSDSTRYMQEVSEFLGIDAGYWTEFDYMRVNSTFSASNLGLHRLALALNSSAEPLWRRYPRLKNKLVGFYKSINQSSAGYEPMDPDVEDALYTFYAPHNMALEYAIDRRLPESWRVPHSEVPELQATTAA